MLGQYQQLLDYHERTLRDWNAHGAHLARIAHALEKHLAFVRNPHMASASDFGPQIVDEEDAYEDRQRDIAQWVQQGFTYGHSASMQAPPYPGLGDGETPFPAHSKGPRTEAYPTRVHATGLPVRQFSGDWEPKWEVFPLKAFRGSSYMYLKIEKHWDDAALLRELSCSYNELRTIWRKWFSLRSVRCVRY